MLFYYRQQQPHPGGVKPQNEFNVEISDYGTREAEDYFEDLWVKAVKIT